MYRFRYQVFRHRLGWSVDTDGEREHDHYDTLNPYYVVDFNHQGQVDACWRILPTTGHYMLKDTFPQLLAGHAAPSDDNIWELSRFAVDARTGDNQRQATLNDLTYMLLQQGYLFAKNQGIERYITVTSVAMERMLLNAGLRLIRFADLPAQKIGKVSTVACWLNIDEDYRRMAFESPYTSIAA
jgi:acyl homoserine lactone synthase